MTACTENEAAEKWCPHMRKALVGNMAMFAGNMDAEGGFAPATCIGSRCMQWRWRDGEIEFWRETIPDHAQGPLTHDEAVSYFATSSDVLALRAAGWELPDPLLLELDTSRRWYLRLHRSTLADRRGYCGLAGKP